jgi:hypothetical protein
MNEEYKAFNKVVGIGSLPPPPNPQKYTSTNKERGKTQRVGWEAAAIITVCAVLGF